MKPKQKTIRFKGLDLGLNIDINGLIDQFKERYRPVFTTLKRMVVRRERYIKKLHKQLRNTDNILYSMYTGTRIHKKVKKLYNLTEKQVMILGYLLNLEQASLDSIKSYFKAANINKPTQVDMDALIEYNYIMASDKKGYYFVTDNGKIVTEKIASAYQEDMWYYMKNKIRKQSNRSGSDNELKYTEEEREKRATLYRHLMTPFWDNGLSRIPRDKKMRCDILKAWIDDKEGIGRQVDERYHKYLAKWHHEWVYGI